VEVAFEGTYEILTTVSGRSAAAAGRYSWREPHPLVTRELSPRDIYDPFTRPATVVGRAISPAREGAPIDPVYVLPQGWERHVAAAAGVPREPSAETLADWLASPNPLLFTRAVTTLTRGGRLDDRLLRSLLDRADGYLRATLHFATLRYGGYLGTETVTRGIDADFSADSESDHRRAAALGLLAARLFPSAVTADALAGWTPLRRPAGIRDEALIAADPYVREAFAILAPA
jgi:hypothetical protein